MASSLTLHKTVLGYKPERYVGNWFFYRPDNEIDETFKGIFLNMSLSQQAFTYEVLRRHKEGHKFWIDLQGAPMFDKEMMLVGREVSKHKKIEKHLEYLRFRKDESETTLDDRRNKFS